MNFDLETFNCKVIILHSISFTLRVHPNFKRVHQSDVINIHNEVKFVRSRKEIINDNIK